MQPVKEVYVEKTNIIVISCLLLDLKLIKKNSLYESLIQAVSEISQFTRQSTTQMIVKCDFCSCLFETSSSILGLILLRAILMSFATLRRLRYVVLILTRVDMAASQR